MTYSLGNFTTIGYAKEATFGTAVASYRWIPGLDINITRDPKLITPAMMRGTIDEMLFAVPGYRETKGPLKIPVFTESGMDLFAWAWGLDNTTGPAAATTSGTNVATTLNGPTTAPTTTVVVTSGTNVTNGMALLIDTGANAETVVVVSGGGTATLTTTATTKNHLTAVAVVTDGNSVGAGDYAVGDGSSLLVVSSANFTVADYVQIGTGLLAEVHKISVIGDATHITIGSEKLSFAHAAGAPIVKVAGPYLTHNITPANTLPSFTLEQNMSGNAIQNAGSLVNQLDLKMDTKSIVEATYGLEVRQDSVLGSPTTAVWSGDILTPYSPTTVTISLDGANDLNVDSATFTLSNGVIRKPTFNGTTYPNVMLAAKRAFKLKATTLLTTLNSGAPGYYALLDASPNVQYTAQSITMTQGSYSLVINLPNGAFLQVKPIVKLGDVVGYDLEVTGFLGSSANAATATIVNQAWQPY